MTAHDPNPLITSTDPVASGSDPVTHVHHDGAPIVVWRTTLDDADATPDPHGIQDSDAGDSPLAPRLAHHLVAIYSDVHSTVVDFDADDTLRHAAESAGRHYLAVTRTAELTTLPRQALLIVLRWPRPADSPSGHDAHSLLSACQQLLTNDGTILIAVTSGVAGQPGDSYREHEQVLLPAAQVAGLRHMHDIVPLPATDGRDTFTYATASDTTASDSDSDPDILRQTTQATLMIFGHSGRRP